MKYKHSSSSQTFRFKKLKFTNFMCAFSKTFSQQTMTATIRHTKRLKQQFILLKQRLYLVDIMSTITSILHGLTQSQLRKS